MFDFFPGTSYSVQSDIYTFLLPQAGQQVGHHFVKLYYLSHHFIKLVYNLMEFFCAMVVILRDNDHNSAMMTILCTCGSAGCNVLQCTMQLSIEIRDSKIWKSKGPVFTQFCSKFFNFSFDW